MVKEKETKNTSKPDMPKELTEPVLMGKAGITILGISLIAAALILGYLVYAFWAPPEVEVSIKQDDTAAQDEAGTDGGAAEEGETAKASEVMVTIFGGNVEMSDEVRLVILVMLVGLIGSYIQATISFVSFVGNRKLVKSWLWYYVARPFAAGPFLALVFYLVVRGGLLSTGSGPESINQYGILAVSGLVGLFSKQAVSKLGEVFSSLFKPPKDELADKLKDKVGKSK